MKKEKQRTSEENEKQSKNRKALSLRARPLWFEGLFIAFVRV